MTPAVRPTARVLLLDTDGRTLLFAGRNAEGRRFWFPPGGGVEAGETHEGAARRELAEETGITDVALGPHLWDRVHLLDVDGVPTELRERWFLARTAPRTIDTSGFTVEERSYVRGHRWWTLDDLRSTDDLLVPRDLATRVADLLASGPPAVPGTAGV